MTKIQWTEKTWNPIIGCSKISPGCQNCYAEKMANRLLYMFEAICGEDGQSTWAEYSDVTAGGRWNGKTAFVSNALDKPLHWKKPSMIFICSIGNLFHESVPYRWIFGVFEIINQCRHHTFQVLTKRPERMQDFYKKHWPLISKDGNYPLDNLWLGVTAENQEQADKRIPILLDIPAAVRFVSVEPMLEDINLGPYLYSDYEKASHDNQLIIPANGFNHKKLDWVIVGCESGPKRRPCPDHWVSSIVSQCDDSSVPVFVKQLALRRDKAGRNVTGLPGLWDESDRLVVSKNPEEWPDHLQVREFPKAR